MTNFLRVLAISILLASCSKATDQEVGLGPFVGIDTTKMSPKDRQTLMEASEDFRAVVAGEKPIHAEFDKDAALPSDGGTTFYKGRGYELTILLSFSSFGGQAANAYGPIITFNPAFAPGNASEISYIRVYSSDELRGLLEH